MKTAGATPKSLSHGGQYVILLSLMSSLAGCASGMGPGSKPPNEAVVKARQEITQHREAVTLLVPRIKARLAGKESGRQYSRAQKLYAMAMVQNNSWVTSLKLAIENAEDVGKSLSFRNKAKAAGDATERFVKFGKKVAEGRASAPVYAAPAFNANDFATVLIQNGTVIWQESRAEDKKDRLAQAAQIEKELRWAKWEELQ